MLQSVRVFVVRLFVWWAREAVAKDRAHQTAWERGKADAIHAAKDGRVFGLVATVVTLTLPAVAGFLAAHLPWPVLVALIVAAGTIGYLLVPVGWAVVGAIGAPVRQRNEARDEIRRLPPSLTAFAEEFSDWVLAKRAALPNLTGRSVQMFISGRRATFPSDSAESARYKGTCDEVQRRAREEYHERFRKQVMTIVRPDKASSPQTIPDLEELAEMVRAYVANHPEGDRP